MSKLVPVLAILACTAGAVRKNIDVDFYKLHPHLYQLRHPWHWLTYGQNATAFGIVGATLVNLVTLIVLVRTLRAVNKQARAADRQAQAAEKQAEAARKQTEVSEQQRIAAERAATAAEKQVEAAISASAVSDAQRLATKRGPKHNVYTVSSFVKKCWPTWHQFSS